MSGDGRSRESRPTVAGEAGHGSQGRWRGGRDREDEPSGKGNDRVTNGDITIRPGERVVGFDRVTADSLGDGMLAEPQRIEFLAGRLEPIDQLEHEPACVRGLHERRKGIEQESAFAEFAQAHSQARQRGQLLAQETRIAH